MRFLPVLRIVTIQTLIGVMGSWRDVAAQAIEGNKGVVKVNGQPGSCDMTTFARGLGVVPGGNGVAFFTLSGEADVIEGGILPGIGGMAVGTKACIVSGGGIFCMAGSTVCIVCMIKIHLLPVCCGVTG